MGGVNETAQQVALILSPLFLLGVLVWKLATDIIAWRAPLRRSRVSGVLVFSIGLLGAVWALRFAVGGYMAGVEGEEIFGFRWYEVLGDSFLHALQTFSMDEDYTGYITSGRAMMLVLTESMDWADAYSIYASVLNIVAPVVGGAFILDILASVFPRLRLWLYHKQIWREKLYFSELTDGSLALAKSMWENSRNLFCKPVVVFTDAYADEEDERSSERLLEAKLMGAICVKDDLAHVAKNWFGKRSYFLVDENESSNLQTLVDLCGKGCERYVRKAKIFLFVEGEGYIQVERQVHADLEERLEAKHKAHEFPDIVPVNSNRNLACNLLVELPLYEPLVDRDKKELHVAIFGENSAAQELLLAVYWFGQILDRKLRIDVVADSPEEDFWAKLDHINPEIKRSLTPEDDILYYSKKACAEPYGEIRYVQADARQGSFWDVRNQAARECLDADYVIVALDSDGDNMAVAEKLQTVIGENHVNRKGSQRAVIAYMVRNARLCETLNGKRRICNLDPKSADVYAYAFGSMKELYSRENIFMTRHAFFAEGVGDAYSAIQRQADSLQENRTRTGRADGDYKYWSDMARAMHIKYKVFSLGWIHTSVFEADEAEHKKAVQEACAIFRKAAKGSAPVDAEKAESLERLKHAMAWLEHRRWNANLRSRGFRSTRAYANYYHAAGDSYKQMELKLHPCLVECDRNGMRSVYDENGMLVGWQDQETFDRLDQLSKKLIELGYNNYDFKKYDYINGEFS